MYIMAKVGFSKLYVVEEQDSFRLLQCFFLTVSGSRTQKAVPDDDEWACVRWTSQSWVQAFLFWILGLPAYFISFLSWLAEYDAQQLLLEWWLAGLLDSPAGTS
jgi:hypothetical protein